MSSFDIKTVQSGAIKVFFTAISKIFNKGTLLINETGIKILEMQDDLIIHSKLLAENFEYYAVERETKLNVDFESLRKIMKTITNCETLTFMKKEEDDFWSIIIANVDKNQRATFKQKIVKETTHKELNIPPAKFNTEITLPSVDFKKILKEMELAESDTLEISQTHQKNLILKGKGNTIVQEYILSESKEGLQYTCISDDLICGVFSYKKLLLCLGFTNLCNQIRMYIKNDYPLIIRYDVANLGQIKLCFQSLNEDEESHPANKGTIVEDISIDKLEKEELPPKKKRGRKPKNVS